MHGDIYGNLKSAASASVFMISIFDTSDWPICPSKVSGNQINRYNYKLKIEVGYTKDLGNKAVGKAVE